MYYSTDRSKVVVPVLVLLLVALWFILRGDMFYVLPCVILFFVFQSFYFVIVALPGLFLLPLFEAFTDFSNLTDTDLLEIYLSKV